MKKKHFFVENLVQICYRGKDFDEITYGASTIPKSSFGGQYYRLEDLLFGELSKLNYSRDQSINLQNGYVFDIDGMIFTSEGGLQLPNLDPQIIESVTVFLCFILV